MEQKIKCNECEIKYYENEMILFDGVHRCDECHFEHCTQCNHCDEIHYISDTRYLEHTDEEICNGCINAYYTKCACCEEYCQAEDTYSIANYGRICHSCFEYHDFYHCERCDDSFHCDDLNFQDDGIYCKDCYVSEEIIHYYSYEPQLLFHQIGNNRNEESGKIYYGVELEVDAKGYIPEMKECAKEIVEDEQDFYCKEDGSLTYGFEIVSHPFTWNYFQSNKDKFQNTLTTSRKYGFLSHDIKTCGMHIHVSKKGLTNLDIFKIFHFVYSNPDFIKVVSNRTWNQLNQWCSLDLNTLFSSITDPVQKVNKLCDIAKNKHGDRKYVALNLSKNHTLEFRIFRGTLNWSTYQKNIQFVQSLIQWCKNTSLKDIQSEYSILSYFDYITKDQTIYDKLVLFLFKKFYSIDLHESKKPPLYNQLKHFKFYERMNFKQLTKKQGKIK